MNVYKERKSLAHSLNDTKTAIEELNRIFSGIALLVIVIVWLILMGFATTHVLVLLSSQLLLVAFIFGNTCKTVFEAIIFVFVMHPFDVGDRCVIDGVQVTHSAYNTYGFTVLTLLWFIYPRVLIFHRWSLRRWTFWQQSSWDMTMKRYSIQTQFWLPNQSAIFIVAQRWVMLWSLLLTCRLQHRIL